MNDDHLTTLRDLVELGESLPSGEWRWKKNYEISERHWAISTPESAATGRILHTDTVLFGGPYEEPPKFASPKPSAIMRLWTAAANARAALKALLAELEAQRAALQLIADSVSTFNGPFTAFTAADNHSAAMQCARDIASKALQNDAPPGQQA